MNSCNLVEVIVGGNDHCVMFGCKTQQFSVNFSDIRVVARVNGNRLHSRRILNILKHIKSAPAAHTLDRIRTVRNMTQLIKHKLRNHHDSLNYAGFIDVKKSSVNDCRGVENFRSRNRASSLFSEPEPRRQNDFLTALCGNQPAEGSEN